MIFYHKLLYLNTSHVKVNLIKKERTYLWEPYLNTSHVKVNQKELTEKEVKELNLNTSHVKVNHNVKTGFGGLTEFKYISC